MDTHGDASWHQWMRLGFEARGFKFRGRMMSPKSIPTSVPNDVARRFATARRNAPTVGPDATDSAVSPASSAEDARWATIATVVCATPQNTVKTRPS